MAGLGKQPLRGAVLSQHDDWMHRGEHPILRDMNLYVYSIWVYRVELRPSAAEKDDQDGLHIDFPFDSSYTGARNWKQRLATEPRIPKVEGFQFVNEDANSETHYLMKSILLRPVYLPIANEHVYTRELRYLQAYKRLCRPGDGNNEWPAQSSGPESPGPFQRSWEMFFQGQEAVAKTARRKCLEHRLQAWSAPSIWNTAEVEQELRLKVLARRERQNTLDADDASDRPAMPGLHRFLTVEEYVALETIKTAGNFDGISKARSSKPKREQEADAKILEAPLYEEGMEESGAGSAQVEGAELRAKQGMAKLGENARISHRFGADTLAKILAFDTAERTQSFVKQLKETPLMSAGSLPAPGDANAAKANERSLRSTLLAPLDGLRSINRNILRALLEKQRARFAKAGKKDSDAPQPDDVPPRDDAQPAGRASQAPQARFVPSAEFRRPSDLVKHLAKKFEAGKPHPKTGKIEQRPLKRDQALFIARFAAATNAVWDDEQQIKEGGLNVKKRRKFNFLLMGQGGSGKTAIVQEIVLPAMELLFPQEPGEKKSTLIVCAKWSQAENISTAEHKAVSCHRAALMGIQSYRNRDMLAKDKKPALKRTWEPVRCLIVEEVSMVSPALFNMVAYRSFLGRADRCGAEEQTYDQLSGAFGNMPIVIQLGDFLQLKPTAAKASLISDFKELAEAGVELFPEYQAVMKLFCRTPLCFELQASNRFKEPRLRELMAFMRSPAKKLPASITATWESILVKPDDARLTQDRFQKGHMIACYWATVSRWMIMRATRDAAALKTPLFLVQPADASSPPMPEATAAKLMNTAAPKDTGGMHGMLGVHLGMQIRLLEALDLGDGLVKDAEGQIVDIVVNPLDQDVVDSALADGAQQVYLKHLPLGFWVKMDKYKGSCCTELLEEHDATLTPDVTESLVFIEAQTSEPFMYREYKVTRTGFPFSHGRVITTTACQGRTMREGVILDCGRHESGTGKKEDDDWWLDLYVMLSRATRIEDLLLIRAPAAEFLLRGPPKGLKKQLLKFARRTEEYVSRM